MTASNLIRGWLTVTTIGSLGNCYQCFVDRNFLTNKIYDKIYRPEISAIYQRLFLLWQLYLVAVQLMCIMHYNNGPLYSLTVLSFAILFCHYSSEFFFFNTANLNLGITLNLSVSGFTVLFMCVCWWWIKTYGKVAAKDDMKPMLKVSKKRAKYE